MQCTCWCDNIPCTSCQQASNAVLSKKKNFLVYFYFLQTLSSNSDLLSKKSIESFFNRIVLSGEICLFAFCRALDVKADPLSYLSVKQEATDSSELSVPTKCKSHQWTCPISVFVLFNRHKKLDRKNNKFWFYCRIMCWLGAVSFTGGRLIMMFS